MFQTWVSLVAFYVALKMGWTVLAPVMATHRGVMLVVTALYFLAWWCAKRIGQRLFGGSRNAIHAWLRDSGLFAALMSYFGIGFIVGAGYLVGTHHSSLALLFAVLGLWLIGSMLGLGSHRLTQRSG